MAKTVSKATWGTAGRMAASVAGLALAGILVAGGATAVLAPSSLMAAASDSEAMPAISETGYSSARSRAVPAVAGEATVVKLSDDATQVQGAGAVFQDGRLVLTAGGRYEISGVLSQGGITVCAGDEDEVELYLTGASITCADNAAILVESAGTVYLTLADGSQNSVSVTGEFWAADPESGIDGAIFCRSDLVVLGEGALDVYSVAGHGIVANDDLDMLGGAVAVTCAKDAVRVNDSLLLDGTALTLSAGDDGIVVDEECGSLEVLSGVCAIQATGDGVNSAGDITMSGGRFEIGVGDDAIHSDTTVNVLGGEIFVYGCYEGIEGLFVNVSGGELYIVSADDGINAAGGDGWTSPCVTISGGRITVVNSWGNDADGIDSNGDIVITGGEVYISLSGYGSNCALDCGSEVGGVCRIDGGVVVACGGSSMMSAPSQSSLQASVMYGLGGTVADGTVVRLMDQNGVTLLEWEVPMGFSNTVVSCPQMQVGGSYLLEMGDESVVVDQTQVSVALGAVSGMGMGPGGHAPRW